MLNNIFRLFLLSMPLCGAFGFADNIQGDREQPSLYNQSKQSSVNTWGCSPDCKCGCNQGLPCTCGSKKYNQVQEDVYNQENRNDTGDFGDYDCCGDDDPFNGGAPPPYYHVPSYDRIIAEECGLCGIWLPEEPVIFRPLLADPRQITYSTGWRFNDQVCVKNIIDVSFGDTIPIYRWFHVWPYCGDLQIELEGALWAIFDPLHDSSPLINADYFGGLTLTYGFDDWAFRLRGYHISSHLGDEFLLNHPGFDRRNASAEFVDFYISWDWIPEIRLYSGMGYTVGEDEEFHTGRWFGGIGTEVRPLGLGFTDWCNSLYGVPFIGMHFRWNKDFKHHIDSTYVLGYEWGKFCGLCHRVRIYIEYHDGYSLEGQFAKCATNYFSLRASYGF